MNKKPGKATPTDEQPELQGRDVWLNEARQALIENGTAGVEINKLAKRLRISRSSFYWFFGSRDQLLNELLDFWVNTSTVLFERILRTSGRNGMQEYRALIDLWIEQKEYDPKWDAAVRDWARTSTAVMEVVRSVDNQRIGVIEQIFLDMGFKGKEAHVRARVTYYHQVGYYAMGVSESRKERVGLLPYYLKVLTGQHH
jgi:AcrR family transcriptional regulator